MRAALFVAIALAAGITSYVVVGSTSSRTNRSSPPTPAPVANDMDAAVAPAEPEAPEEAVADTGRRKRDESIPQDPVRQQERLRAKLEWNRRSLAGAYDAGGKKDARWDEAAHRALEAAARYFSHAAEPRAYIWDVQNRAREAIQAGCNDPLILYLHCRCYDDDKAGPSVEKVAEETRVAARAMAASSYSVSRRSRAWLTLADQTNRLGTPAGRAETGAALDQGLVLLVQSPAQDERSAELEKLWYTMSLDFVAAYRRLGVNPETALARVDAVLAQSPELAVTRLLVRGRFYLDLGREARGTAAAAAVSAQNMARFDECSAKAQDAFTRAWTASPGNGHAASGLLRLQLGHSQGREVMESWFRAAMRADSDNHDACFVKLEWLHPYWHGTIEEYIAFARACRDTRNAGSKIPLLVVHAHQRVYDVLARESRPVATAYIRRDDVWNDMAEVFAAHLKQEPLDHFNRTRYAYWASLAGRDAVAHRQFKILGNNLSGDQHYSTAQLIEIRDLVAQRVGKR